MRDKLSHRTLCLYNVSEFKLERGSTSTTGLRMVSWRRVLPSGEVEDRPRDNGGGGRGGGCPKTSTLLTVETNAFFLIGEEFGPDDCADDVDWSTSAVVSAVTSGRKTGALLLAEPLLPRSLWILLFLLELELLDMFSLRTNQLKGMDWIRLKLDNDCNHYGSQRLHTVRTICCVSLL